MEACREKTVELLAEELANDYGGEYCPPDGHASIEEPLDSLLQAVHALVQAVHTLVHTVHTLIEALLHAVHTLIEALLHAVHTLGKLLLPFFKTPNGVGGLALPVLQAADGMPQGGCIDWRGCFRLGRHTEMVAQAGTDFLGFSHTCGPGSYVWLALTPLKPIVRMRIA